MNADFFSTSNLLKLGFRIFLILLGLVLLIEGVLWAAFRTPLNPSSTFRFNNHIPGLKEKVTFEVTSVEQMRTRKWEPGPKSAGSLRILCVGGPATMGQLQNTDDTWWGQLAALLEEKLPGVKLEIAANAGVPYLAMSGTKWVATFAPDWQPDLIIANFGAGEVLSQPLEQYRYNAKLFETLPPAKRVRSAWKEAMIQVSQISRWWVGRDVKYASLRSQAVMGEENYFSDFFKLRRSEYQKLVPISNPFRLSDADPRNEYRDALKHLLVTSQSVGAQLILTGEPCLCRELMTPENAALLCTFVPKSTSQPSMMVKVQTGWVERELRRYQEVAQELAKENQLTFVDLNETILPDADHFVDEMILTDQGAREMAAQLLPKVWSVVNKIRGL